MTVGLLAVVTVVRLPAVIKSHSVPANPLQFIGVTAEWLVDSIGGLVEGGGITKEFVGVILLPIVGNAAGWWKMLVFWVGLNWLDPQNMLPPSQSP
jgi:Ca2+/H+ antiporter